MSEIDKLVNRAFPDELRNVEPVSVDEDAVFARTLEKLGLDAPGRVREGPTLLKKDHGKIQEKKWVEVPPETVKHRWMSWTGWAVAACLVVACAVSWGPWLASNLGFGTREPGPAEKGLGGGTPYSLSSGSSETDGVFVPAEVTGHTPYPPFPTPSAGESGEISAEELSIGDGGFTVDLRFSGMSVAEIGRFEIAAYNAESGEALECSGRTNASGRVEVSFLWDQKYLVGEARLEISRLTGDGSSKYDFEFVDSFLLDLASRKITSMDDSE
ncbi:hypothetical protein D7X94_02620 [Acutalibacter sp. 1XD8-33]|uniref:hypothetical protein n=1 Tax=Acutalibacter sp. 1XD8-33 TaxID=2320081 RepID=UPI000EA0ABAE|nr:hypothetical protein [Acutalibacter sp. 1XD8-33]RKJ41726.1 hypothetical protein D7X94_02620 [Acutalibacter sp. 1XD8-33]